MKTSSKLIKTAILLCAFIATAHAQPTDNVAAYYPFNGNANDATVGGKNGTVIGTTLVADRLGTVNDAYSFNGSSNKINLPKTLLNSNSAYTLSIWIKPSGIHSTSESYQFVVDLRAQYQIAIIYYQSNNSIPNSVRFYTVVGTTYPMINSASNSIQLNQWNHIVATYSNNLMELYLNGVRVGSNSALPPNAVSAYTFNTLGKDGNSSANQCWYYGELDEVLLYNRGLTSNEVQALYNRGLTSSEIPELYNKPNLQYTYDAIGRRTSRNAIVLKSASISNAKDSSGIGDAFARGNVFEDNLGNKKVVIYPNPTKGQLLIELQGYENETNTALYLFDLSGKLLISKKPVSSSMPLDLSNYSAGTYVLKIMLGDKTSEWKIIKE